MSNELSPTGVEVDASVREISEDLGIDYRSFFINLGKATVSGLVGFSTGNPGAFATSISNLLNSFSAFKDRPDIYEKVGDDPSKLAWLLIHQSLIAAVTDLVGDHDARFRAAYQDAEELPTEEEIGKHLEESMDLNLAEAEVRITPSFFDRPTEPHLLESLQRDLAAWFEAVGVPEGEATSISTRLPSYFRTALIDEWREHSEYQRLEEAVQVPFAHAQRRAQAWEAYRAHLQKQVDEPVFGEAVSLRQIYIWPRTFVQIPKEDSEADQPPLSHTNTAGEGDLRGEPEAERRVSWLRKSVLEWLKGEDESDAIRIIKGDPGTGKSSFAKMLAAELAQQNEHAVLFAPLSRLDATKQLTEAIQQFVSAPDHPLNGIDPFDETPLLLILDGLDELSKRGRVGADVARDFVDAINRALRGLNQGSVAVRVLLSGRRIAADAGAKILRDPTKVFNLIPFVPEGDSDRYEDPDFLAFDEDEEPIDHRDDWWQKYGEASGSDYDEGMPSRLRRDRLGEITRQPLLNYLVALAYEDDDTDFSEDASLNTLYDQLLDGVYRRDYDFGPHPGTKVVSGTTEEMQKEGFVRVLEEIALDAWHGDGRTTTLASIEKRCKREGLIGYFENVQNKLATGISQLLAAFYFRKTGQTPQGEATFEFTHKTFAEYLTGRRIVRTVMEIHDERQRNEERGGRYGLDLEGSLRTWIGACGPSAMDEDLFQFFNDELRIRHKENNCASDWKETFSDLIRYVLHHDMPMHKVDATLDYKTEKLWARNAEEALLAVAQACRHAQLAETEDSAQKAGLYAINVLEEVPQGTAMDWIRRLQVPVSEHSDALYSELLSPVDWSDTNLSKSFLYKTQFALADLQEIKLKDANLHLSIFYKSDLQEANLQGANVSFALFYKTDLRGADLRGANLRDAFLEDADLRETDLRGTDLRGLTLPETRYRRLIPFEIEMPELNLQEVNLQDAQWGQTQVSGIKIDKKTLMDDNLRDYILSQNPDMMEDVNPLEPEPSILMSPPGS
ncbi:pentapeptide repeat-containing protein [Salinibacter ruber]|uniref:pentapeptide repeat-containing protein n=1 Tax=Salinibacter ruber TaxID=146919 RepID=UPI002169F3E1|nr:pentapeptide repeat-containing protein [Salinibacter ruber]MCS3697578.1 hypothetical protein [Salinibacter ruber]